MASRCGFCVTRVGPRPACPSARSKGACDLPSTSLLRISRREEWSMSEQDELSEPAFAAIGLAVEPVTPPAALRAQILSAAEPTTPVLIHQRRRLPWSLLAAAMVRSSVAAFLLGQRRQREVSTGPIGV